MPDDACLHNELLGLISENFVGRGAVELENCALLGYYAASNDNFLPTFRDNLSVPSSSPEPIGCPETSVRNYHYSLHNSPVECGSHLLRGGSLKLRSRTSITCGSYISSQSTYSRNDRRGYSFYYLDPIIF